MENNYWNGNGKYQNFVNKIENIQPDIGYTDNKYLNAFIVMEHYYYDNYNNGCWNTKDGNYKEDRIQYLNSIIRTNYKKLCNPKEKEYLEEQMNNLIEKIKDKVFSYTKYSVWQKFNEKLLSHTAIDEEDWQEVSFGEKEEYDDWIKVRISKSWDFKFIN